MRQFGPYLPWALDVRAGLLLVREDRSGRTSDVRVVTPVAVTFSSVEVRALTGGDLDATPVSTRDPARPFEDDEELPKTSGVFADLAARLKFQPVHVSVSAAVSKLRT